MRTIKQQLNTAIKYRDAGISIIPIRTDGTKAPMGYLLPDGKWEPFQERIATESEIAEWFGGHHAVGFGIIGGKVSGNLEILDIDNYDLVAPYRNQLNDMAPGLYERMVRVKTPRPGLHSYYRVPYGSSCGKLARERIMEDGKSKVKTLIETKGEGGYVVAPGSPASCHKLNKKYLLGKRCSMQSIPLLSRAEHESVLEAAKAFNEISRSDPKIKIPRPTKPLLAGTKPWDVFNHKADWKEILEPHGWSVVKVSSTGEVYWRHPDASGSWSAVTGPETAEFADRLRVFSPNTVFETVEVGKESIGKSYTKFDALKMLQFKCDFHATLRHVKKLGYEGVDLPFLQTAPPSRRGRRR